MLVLHSANHDVHQCLCGYPEDFHMTVKAVLKDAFGLAKIEPELLFLTPSACRQHTHAQN